MRCLLEHGARVNSEISAGSALLLAASGGHTGILQKLLENGSRFDEPSIYQSTELYAASSRGYIDVIAELPNSGADVNRQSSCFGSVY